MNGERLGLASGTGLRSRTFVSADGATVAVQDGNVPKHLHVNANEMQYILEGTGTIWLGDKEVQVKPGDLVIIPKGTPHGGTKPDGRPFKTIAIKTPPQAPDDTKLLD
jgi:mannose-6-phosphate isomerase-like protein (cupin superfamily)